LNWFAAFPCSAGLDERHPTQRVSSAHRGSETKGADVKLINTDGMAFIGPGSEWFWTALSGIVLAVTFLAIYRQLALARGANAFAQLGALTDEWDGERLVRKRIAIIVALRDGAASVDIPQAPADAVANYWEKVGTLVRAGHIPASLVAEGMGSTHVWWGILAPYVLKWRTEDANPDLWEHFEWLAGTIVRLHPAAAFDQQSFDRTLEQRIANNESDLRILEAMRTVIVASQPPTE
jgi:hypothetical protein